MYVSEVEYQRIRRREQDGRKRQGKIEPIIPEILKIYGTIGHKELTGFVIDRFPELKDVDIDELRCDINGAIWHLISHGKIVLTSDRRLQLA